MKPKQLFWQKFKTHRLAYCSSILLALLLLLLSFLEFFVNDRPIVVYQQGKWYFPIVQTYTLKSFNNNDKSELLMDYKSPSWQKDLDREGWAIWPLVPYSYQSIDYALEEPAPSKPSKQHWLGTDTFGRDVLAFTLYSLRFSLLFGILLTAISSVIGIIFGALQGYFGGKIDLFGQRFLEIWSGLPQLFILIILAGIIYPTFWSMLGILLLFSWTNLVPVVRAEFLKVRQMDYVRAAKALGISNTKIIFRHILPNAIVATLTFMPFILTGSIVILASLDYLGLGLPSGAPAFGELLRQGQENLFRPNIGLTGFIVLGSVLSLLMFISEGIRYALDPKTSKN